MLKPKIKQLKRKNKSSEKGMAIIEAIPVLFMVVLIFNFSLGFFGVVHSGILNSIGSYNYALETFRFKSNLVYFRPGALATNYVKSQNRVHGITQDGTEDVGKEAEGKWPVTLRGITYNYKPATAGRDLASIQDSKKGKIALTEPDREFKVNPSDNNIWSIKSKFVPKEGPEPVQTARVWIKTVYGICLNADCKPQ